jgi:3-hydroxyisobutyrate dehydrogenase-like beta-hydroxyacid dehydrogenase
MGSGLGWALREGGARVVTTLADRSARTARLVAAAGLECLTDLDDVVRSATHILVVTPPGEAVAAAMSIADAARRTGSSPLVADLNAIAPSTAESVAATLEPLEFVDGSISGAPPTVRPGVRVFFSGPRAAEFVALPWRHVTPIDVGPVIGAASAVKMSSASVYKGLAGLYAQAIRTADHYHVLDIVLDELRHSGYDMVRDVAVAATKAHRYAPEMREISKAQAQAGLTPELFAAFAEVYAQIATTPLADDDPESVGEISADDVVRRLRFPD